MSDTRLYTWLDVESKIQKQKRDNWPREIKNIQVYANGLDVFLRNKADEAKAKKYLNLWFGDWYNEKDNLIYLESATKHVKSLDVIFIQDNYQDNFDSNGSFRPFFGELALFTDHVEDHVPDIRIGLPASIKDSPGMLAFYSFKGGVGRTVHVVAALKSILSGNGSDKPRVLLVDADIEAPGLTWWAMEKGELPELSFLDFLALANDDIEPYKNTFEVSVKKLNETILTVDKHKIYFLPAFRSMDQLLRVSVKPEHLVRNPGNSWVVGNLLFHLGKMLKVDYILVDLRAGLSELSAPFIFDPRILRFLITTYSSQSVEGMRIVLRQMAKIVPLSSEDKEEVYYDPYLVFSMVPEDLKYSDKFIAIQRELIGQYPDHGEDDATPSRLTAVNTFFAQQLLYLESFEQTWDKLSGTSVLKETGKLLNDVLAKRNRDGAELKVEDIKSLLSQLISLSTDLEYAESGKSVEYLPIPAIRNLGQKYTASLPVAVVIGSKGSGKTHMYLQLTRLGNWKNFLGDLQIDMLDIKKKENPLEVFPLLESLNLHDAAKEITSNRREKVWEYLSKPEQWNQSKLRDEVNKYLKDDVGWDYVNWRSYWFHLIGLSLGMNVNSETELISIEKIQAYLKKQHLKVIILIDGLEDIFDNVRNNDFQKLALKGLLDVPEVLREFRESYLGVVCFIRRDLIRAVIRQNIGHYESRYSPYDLTWNFEEALRLVLWVWYKIGNIPGVTKESLLSFDRNELAEHLIPFWGRKLGAAHSKEAVTANWVLAALSDFQGQLQARDLVRFIKNAAIESEKNIVYKDRLLQPAAIRKAIQPCSTMKISEIEDEFPGIKSVFNKLRQYKEERRKIPFTADKLDLTAQEIEQLEALGVLQKVDEKYYMPEIFRYGLGFTLDRGARPMVLALKKRFLPGL